MLTPCGCCIIVECCWYDGVIPPCCGVITPDVMTTVCGVMATCWGVMFPGCCWWVMTTGCWGVIDRDCGVMLPGWCDVILGDGDAMLCCITCCRGSYNLLKFLKSLQVYMIEIKVWNVNTLCLAWYIYQNYNRERFFYMANRHIVFSIIL